MTEPASLLAALAAHPEQPAVLATLVRVEGSFYRRPGARLLVVAGSRHGAISAGCIEEDLLLRAERVRQTARAEIAVYDTTQETDLVWGVGQGCQGVVRILLEPMALNRPRWIEVLDRNLRRRRPTPLVVIHDGPPNDWGTRLADETAAEIPADHVWRETIAAPPALVVFGAGNDAQPVVRLAKEMGWHVTVADARPAYATAERFPAADRVVVQAAGKATRLIENDDTGVVIMTHRFLDDAVLLRTLLPRSLRYLGLLGPHQRSARLLEQLQAEGFVPDDAAVARLHAPIGLDLGGSSPEAIALSILAELQCRWHGRVPASLRSRPGPIHA